MHRTYMKYSMLFAAWLLLFTVACSDEYADGLRDGDPSGLISFKAYIQEGGMVNTRVGADDEEEPDSVYVAHTPWDQDFYIQLNTTDKDGKAVTQYGVYQVPSAYDGRLDAIDREKMLNWQNLDRDHTFYSWTVPWRDDYEASDDTLKVIFKNSSEKDGFDENVNNAIYEGFIGAKSVPYSYKEHGKYVDLTFHHLVSKIRIESLILIQTDGTVQKDLQADMTFVGMPVEATFYPHPRSNDGSGAPDNWRPYVGKPYGVSPDNGVTYYIKNDPQVKDVFYICPEVDFSKIDYQVKINSEEYKGLQTYYGSFDEVVFERIPGDQYDRPLDTEGDTVDSKILHAGEEMRLNIVLIPGKGPGLKVIIQKWSTEQGYNANYHSHPGFYTNAELQEMMDLLYGFSAGDYDNPPSELAMLFDMYGYTGEDGKKYFPLYENLTPKKGNSTSNIFPIPPGYVIDGMGHVVTLKTNRGSYWPGEGTSDYFNVGGYCKDIYFTDENGNNTIYIDNDYYVWITDPETGQLKKTKNRLPDPMDPGMKGFDISCTTGSIRQSAYYNDHIVG